MNNNSSNVRDLKDENSDFTKIIKLDGKIRIFKFIDADKIKNVKKDSTNRQSNYFFKI